MRYIFPTTLFFFTRIVFIGVFFGALFLFFLTVSPAHAANTHSISFDGVDDEVMYGTNTFNFVSSTTPFTFEFWQKSTTTATNATIFSKRINPPGGAGYTFYATENGDVRAFSYDCRHDGGAEVQQYTLHVSSSDNLWRHYAAVKDMGTATSAFSFYINGIRLVNASLTADITGDLAAGNCNQTQGFHFSIGNQDGISQYFSGQIDDFRVWDNPRTALEIQSNKDHELTGLEPHLIGYFKFNNDYADSSPFGHTGTSSGSPVFTSDVPFQAESFSTDVANRSALSASAVLVSEEPVNTLFGNYLKQERDISVPGRGVPLEFTRTYNSISGSTSALGPKWTHNYAMRLNVFSDGVIVVNEDGREDAYLRVSTSTFTPQAGVFDTLVQSSTGSFALTRKNQTVLFFDASGILHTITDRNGNAVTLFYNGDGLLATSTDQTGRSLRFSYDGENHLAVVTDPAGHAYHYSYNGDGNLASSTNPLDETTQYFYDSEDRLIKVIDANGNTVIENTYDNGRVVLQKDGLGNETAYAYSPASTGTVTVITDPQGNETVHEYDADSRIRRVTDAQNSSTSYEYDAGNNRTSIIDARGNQTLFAYDDRGNLTRITDPLGNVLSFTYDSANNLLTATNAKNATTTFVYDSRSNLLSITDAVNSTTTFVYNSFGELTQKKDARGNATNLSYDVHGNLKKITDALGNKTTFAFDTLSRLLSLTDALNNTASTSYDAVGRLLAVRDPLGNKTNFLYDAVGNLTRITDVKNQSTRYFYDAKNELSSVFDSASGTTSYSYDVNGNRTAVTDANGNTTHYDYDALNRLATSTDPLGNSTRFSYDAAGNLSTLTNAKSETISFDYDALNRLITKTLPGNAQTSFAYDENGNIVFAENSDVAYRYAYDALNRLVSFTDNRFPATSTYAYDANGNRISLDVVLPPGSPTSPLLKNDYVYDALNRLTRITDSENRNYDFSYDALSRRTRLTLPNGVKTDYAYDAADRLLDIATKNPLNNPLAAFQYAYDSLGNRLSRIEEIVPPIGGATSQKLTYEYDSLSRLLDVKQKTRLASPQPPLRAIEEYAYDGAGNRLIGPQQNQSYTYNSANELLQVKNILFAYDNSGNVIEKTDADNGTGFTFTYDAENRLVEAVKTDDGETTTAQYVYDPFGRRIEKQVNGTVERFFYDNEDILFIADNNNRVVSTFVHGPGIDEPLAVSVIARSEPRATRQSNSSLTDLQTALSQLASLLSVLQNRLASAILTASVNVQLPRQSDTFFYFYDGLGSVVGLTDNKGKVAQKYDYDSFGNLKGMGQGPVKQPYTYTGREFDQETGLYYYRARYYDAEVGRFISRDSLPSLSMSPQDINIYLYVLNNPGTFNDPLGLAPVVPISNDFLLAGLALSNTAISKQGLQNLSLEINELLTHGIVKFEIFASGLTTGIQDTLGIVFSGPISGAFQGVRDWINEPGLSTSQRFARIGVSLGIGTVVAIPTSILASKIAVTYFGGAVIAKVVTSVALKFALDQPVNLFKNFIFELNPNRIFR
ncbi:MAG: hypothetical protein A3J67_05340 [Parcubacteria group bacterium RIFCSPHIGHO2_02_FULL_48_10b]|nr:MAG: hypothetical protein A3J67_05340 [Parcubacteria group bacterium RIFCSPHIGHO2_02_FULL_48_10b]